MARETTCRWDTFCGVPLPVLTVRRILTVQNRDDRPPARVTAWARSPACTSAGLVREDGAQENHWVGGPSMSSPPNTAVTSSRASTPAGTGR